MPTSTAALPGTIITNLPAATSIDGSEKVPIVQGGTTKYGTTGQIAGSLTTNVTGAPYVLMSTSPTLTAARVLTASSPITVTDGGAGVTATIGLSATALTSNSTLPFIVASSASGLTGSRTLTATAPLSVSDGGASSNFTVSLSSIVTVPFGGTGSSGFTVFQPIVGGVVSSGPMQSVTIGSSGQVLMHSSANTLPSWQGASTVIDTLGSSQGAILYRSSLAWTPLTIGTSAQVLTGGTIPQWAAPAAGGGTVANSSGGRFAYYSSDGNSVTGSSLLVQYSSGSSVGLSVWIPSTYNGVYFAVGAVSTTASSGNLSFITINGAANGIGAGSFIQGDNNGALAWAAGNYSAIFGGAYDQTFTLASTAGYRFTGLSTGPGLVSLSSIGAASVITGVSAGRPLLSGGTGTISAYSSTWLFFDDTNKFQRITKNNGSVTPVNLNTLLHLVGSSAGVEVSLEMTSFNTDVVYNGIRYNGTSSTPTALNSSEQIVSIVAGGMDGVSSVPQQGGTIGIFSGGAWSSGSHPTDARIWTVPVGSVNPFVSAKFLTDGGAYFTKQTTFAPVAYPTTPVVQAVGANNAYAYSAIDCFGSSAGVAPYMVFRAARGVSSAFTPSQIGDPLGGFFAVGAQANNLFASPVVGANGGAAMVCPALEAWSTTAQGAAIQFFTTPIGTIAQNISQQLHGSGGVSVGLSGIANDPGTGNLATKNALIAGSTYATAAGGSSIPRLAFGSTGIGIYFGSGAPTITVAQGSLYLRTDGSGTTNRLYVNMAGSSTWTAFTSSA